MYDSLSRLNNEIKDCTGCVLYKTRTHSVIGEGNPESKLFIIAQAPGDQEDLKNRMFVGPSGGIFRELIKKAGLTWNDFYISNLIKCRLPQCRKPKIAEIRACSSYLDREIKIIKPEIMAPLGYYAARYLLQKYEIANDLPKAEFPDLIGKTITTDNNIIFPLSHPASALYHPAWEKNMVSVYKKLVEINKDIKLDKKKK